MVMGCWISIPQFRERVHLDNSIIFGKNKSANLLSSNTLFEFNSADIAAGV